MSFPTPLCLDCLAFSRMSKDCSFLPGVIALFGCFPRFGSYLRGQDLFWLLSPQFRFSFASEAPKRLRSGIWDSHPLVVSLSIGLRVSFPCFTISPFLLFFSSFDV